MARNVRSFTNKLIERLEDGELDWESVCRECLSYMSEDDVADMCERADFFYDEERNDVETDF